MSLIQSIQNSIKRKKLRYNKRLLTNELKRIERLPRYHTAYTSIFGKPFKFHDNLSFIHTYGELLDQEIYRFSPRIESNGLIIDCGANMGLSVLFFALNYPTHKIIAFEPDVLLFNILNENVNTFELKNVELVNKAVWTEETELNFFTDGGMGGRVNQEYESQQPVKVQSVALVNYLNNDNIDFLKIDIEGAESEVIKSCSDKLKNVNYLFFEYHNIIDKAQILHQLLELVADKGFTYYIKESAVRTKPFIEKPIICETFDMALNVFCYKML